MDRHTEQTYVLAAIESLRNEVLARHDATNGKIDGIHSRLDVLNGKTAKNALDVGRVKWALSGVWTLVLIVAAAVAKRFIGG
jgi:hypothetical protein